MAVFLGGGSRRLKPRKKYLNSYFYTILGILNVLTYYETDNSTFAGSIIFSDLTILLTHVPIIKPT